MPLDSKTIIEKRAGEKLIVGMDFGPWLATDETITTINSIDAGSAAISNQTISGSRVMFFVDGGVAGDRYEVTVNITTNLDQILIGEGPLKVLP